MIVVINKNIVTEACVYPVAVCLARVNAISFLNLSLDNQSKLDGSIVIFFNNCYGLLPISARIEMDCNICI